MYQKSNNVQHFTKDAFGGFKIKLRFFLTERPFILSYQRLIIRNYTGQYSVDFNSVHIKFQQIYGAHFLLKFGNRKAIACAATRDN